MIAENICLVIPMYNEASRLNIPEYEAFLESHEKVDLLLVNDGSRDDTLGVINSVAERYSNAKVLDLVTNHGKAAAVRLGMLEAAKKNYSWVAYWDADLATPFSEVRHFASLFQNPQIDMIMGTRLLRLGVQISRKWYRHYLGRIFATFVSLALKLPVYDTQCGAKFIKGDLVEPLFKAPFLSKWIFDVELLFRLRNYHREQGRRTEERVFELPLNFWKDVTGSKLSPFDFLKAPFELLRIHRHY